MKENKLIHTIFKPNNINDLLYDDLFLRTLEKYIEKPTFKLQLYGPNCSGKSCIIHTIIKILKSKYKLIDDNILYIDGLDDNQTLNIKKLLDIFVRLPLKHKIIVIDNLDHIIDKQQYYIKSRLDRYEDKLSLLVTSTNLHKIVISLKARIHSLKIPIYDMEKICDHIGHITKTFKYTLRKDQIYYLIDKNNFILQKIYTDLEKIYLYNISNEVIEDSVFYNLCGLNEYALFTEYLEYCLQDNYECSFGLIDKIIEKGYNVIDFLDFFNQYIKVSKNISEELRGEIIKLISYYITIYYTIHEDNIELSLFTLDLIKIGQTNK